MKNLYAKLKLTNSFPYQPPNSNYIILNEYSISCFWFNDTTLNFEVKPKKISREDMLYLSSKDGINVIRVKGQYCVALVENGFVRNIMVLWSPMVSNMKFGVENNCLVVTFTTSFNLAYTHKFNLRDFSLVL